MSVEITFQRSPHDREHPYTMVSNELLDNKEISNNLKMLLIYCLRKPASWIFSLKNLLETMHLKERCLYKIIDEGIRHGYIQRQLQKFNGKFQSSRYFFSESPVFKKRSPCAQNVHSVNIFENAKEPEITREEGTFSKKDRRVHVRASISNTSNTSNTSKTYEFEASQSKPLCEDTETSKMRDDIEALPFGCKDKRILNQYPREAIAYAKRCISKMPITPKKPVAVFTNLCKSYLSKESSSPQRQKKSSYEGVGRFKKTVVNKCPFTDEFTFLCGKGQFYYEVTFEDIVVKIREKWYRIDKSDALFEEKMKQCIRILHEEISRAT